MYSLQHSGSRWASPGGNIRGKSSVRRRRARPWQRPPGAPGALPAPEAAWARAWAHAAPPAGGARARERPRTRVRLPRAAPCFPGGRLFQEGPRASFSPGIACSPRLGCFQTVLVGEEVNVGCRSPFAAEGRGSARGGCVGNSRGQIPSPGAGAGKAQPTHRGGRDEPQGLARGGKARDHSCSLFPLFLTQSGNIPALRGARIAERVAFLSRSGGKEEHRSACRCSW